MITLHFGKYKGLSLQQVCQDYPNYIFALLKKVSRNADNKKEFTLNDSFREEAWDYLNEMDYRMPYGCHKGKMISQIPSSYRDWMYNKLNEKGDKGFLTWKLSTY